MLLMHLTFFVAILITIIWSEYYNRRSFKEVFMWIWNQKTAFIMNYLSLAFIILFIQTITNNSYLSIAISTLLILLLSLISMYKARYRGDSLFPWDLGLGKESSNMAQFVSDIRALMNIFLIIIFPIFIFVLNFFASSIKMQLDTRLILGFISILALLIISFRPSKMFQSLFIKLNIDSTTRNQGEAYNDNGFLLAFLMNIKKLFIYKPEDYSENTVKSIINDNKHIDEEQKLTTKKPNIIVIMNETFWDPTLLDRITFGKDPIPTFHSLSKKHTNGYLVSPEFGGGTSNIEFEILTGHSMNFFPTGSMAFNKYLTRPTTSLATIFKENGYETLGLHSYKRWFWKRDIAYDLLGFDKFISCEEFENPEYKGTFISDEEFSRKVIEEKEKVNKPIFIYGITMQNHAPYSNKRYTETEIKVDGNLSNQEKAELETYTQGVHDADKSLKILIDYFSKLDEPTVIAFFGDHLPMLGEDFSIFKKAGFINSTKSVNWNEEEKLKMQSVPLLVWSNYKQQAIDIKYLSTSFFGSYLLDYIGFNKPAYFNYIYNFSKRIPVFLDRIHMPLINDENKSFIEDEKRKYWLLQYDQLFGENYISKL